ncbi:LOW QUALITY PROTEIN: START domain containing 14 [Neosynchiropus ocellatus]
MATGIRLIKILLDLPGDDVYKRRLGARRNHTGVRKFDSRTRGTELTAMSCILPDDAAFCDFRQLCLSAENWVNKYDKEGIQVWMEVFPSGKGVTRSSKIHKIKCKMTIKDVSAATMYDVIHDGQYRKKWDPTTLESFDIARLSDHADVGYYSWLCPNPIKNRDVVTLRSWRVMDGEYIVINFSVKHAKFPPREGLVRAISILTGYYIKPLGPNSCSFIYLSEADPKGFLPKWVVNKASQVLAPKVMRCVYKAGQNYPEWKRQNSPDQKPWLYPEQNTLPTMDPAELAIQRGDSLENVDESSQAEQE